MVKFKGLFSSKKQDWRTPEKLYSMLDAEFHFDYDPCPSIEADEFRMKDGYSSSWGNCNYVNPPYNEVYKWVKKGYEEALKGKTSVFLIPSRTDTRWWFDYIMKAYEVRFVKGRLRFGGAKHPAPFPSVIVVFKKNSSNPSFSVYEVEP